MVDVGFLLNLGWILFQITFWLPLGIIMNSPIYTYPVYDVYLR